jgi:hypothetical protein
MYLSAATKISLIFMMSATAFCAWSIAWMGVVIYHTLRDALT